MITINIINRTYFISVNNDTGSAFTIEHKDKQYIISAKHVFESLELKNGSEIMIQIFHDEIWKNLKCKAHLHDNPEIDIIVLKTDQLLFNKFPVTIGHNDLNLARDVYFLGFPYGMFTPDLDGQVNQKFPIPFIKKGIFSAFLRKYDIITYYIDAHNNTGFSYE